MSLLDLIADPTQGKLGVIGSKIRRNRLDRQDRKDKKSASTAKAKKEKEALMYRDAQDKLKAEQEAYERGINKRKVNREIKAQVLKDRKTTLEIDELRNPTPKIRSEGGIYDKETKELISSGTRLDNKKVQSDNPEVEYDPKKHFYTSKITGSREDVIGLQKGVVADLQGASIADAEAVSALDDLDMLIGEMREEGVNEFTVQSDVNNWFYTTARRFDIPMSDSATDRNQHRTKIKGQVDILFNAYRNRVTGKQASAFELKLIKKQINNMDDSLEGTEAKLVMLRNFFEQSNVRNTLALSRGLKFSRTSGDGSPIYIDSDTGMEIPLTKIASLASVPTQNQRFNQLMNEQITGEADQSMIKEAAENAKSMMIEEGYFIGAQK